MKGVREIFLNEESDCDWLRSTHLKHVDPNHKSMQFDSFVLYGNEDSPVRLDLYSLQSPAYNDQPIAVYEQNADGEMQLKEQP